SARTRNSPRTKGLWAQRAMLAATDTGSVLRRRRVLERFGAFECVLEQHPVDALQVGDDKQREGEQRPHHQSRSEDERLDVAAAVPGHPEVQEPHEGYKGGDHQGAAEESEDEV